MEQPAETNRDGDGKVASRTHVVKAIDREVSAVTVIRHAFQEQRPTPR